MKTKRKRKKGQTRNKNKTKKNKQQKMPEKKRIFRPKREKRVRKEIGKGEDPAR